MLCSESALRSRDYLALLHHYCSFVRKKRLHAHEFHWRDMECRLWNPKYVSHVYKVTVAVDMLATLYGFAPWPPGHQLMF